MSQCFFLPDDNFEFGGMDPNGDEEEEDEEVDQIELQRRKERLEREQWIREQVCVSLVESKCVLCVCI